MAKKVESFKLRDGMSLEAGQKVEIYYNIQKGGFSIVSRDSRNPNKGKVVAYTDYALIEDATFHLDQNKLAKILERHCKTVYATVKGIFQHSEEMDNTGHCKGYCNPYTTGKFIDWETKAEIKKASVVYFYDKFFSYK